MSLQQQQQQQQQQEGIITTRSKSRLESFDAAELLSEPNDGLLGDNHRSMQQQQQHNTRARTRSIPVPVPQPEQQQQQQTQSSSASAASASYNNYPPQTQSAASSQGSSGSAFLSSVLNPPSSSSTLLSHTPPTALGTSYENAHFGKRPRSGSVSGRLRSASEYLEEKGLLDRQTKGILKDLIIIGDEELQQALDHYEAGDPSSLEQMIQSGALQNRLPQDLDILGDLDLDFLTMDDEDMVGVVSAVGDQHIDALPNQYHVEKYMPRQQQGEEGDNDDDDDVYNATDAQVAGALHALAHQPHSAAASKTITPNDEDNTGMVGDLEFAGEFVSDHTAGGDDYRLQQQQQQHYASKDAAAAAASSGESPPTDYNAPLSDYEKRLRSNSLFSALLDPATRHAAAQNAATSAGPAGGAGAGGSQYGQWMDRYPPITTANRPGGIQIGGGKARGRSKAGGGGRGTGGGGSNNKNTSGLAASLEADRKMRDKEDKKRERQERKEKKLQEKKRAAATAAAAMEEEPEDQHVPGSGRPRSLSDSQLRYSLDEQGLQQCERPEGWVGAYSPDSRKVRIGRFLEKRNHRVWTKTVKYDVRKNFADSRLRVKGRFVKKEDELMMRELMSLT